MVDHDDPDIIGYFLSVRRKCLQDKPEQTGSQCLMTSWPFRCDGCNYDGTRDECADIELESVDMIHYVDQYNPVPIDPELRVRLLWEEKTNGKQDSQQI